MKIQIKHLLQYLQQFDPELEVVLDKDGWMEKDCSPKNELDLIEQRGVFWYCEGKYLIINN